MKLSDIRARWILWVKRKILMRTLAHTPYQSHNELSLLGGLYGSDKGSLERNNLVIIRKKAMIYRICDGGDLAVKCCN